MFKVRNTINNEVTVFETMEMVNDHIKSEIEWFNSPNENKNGNGYDSGDFIVDMLSKGNRLKDIVTASGVSANTIRKVKASLEK